MMSLRFEKNLKSYVGDFILKVGIIWIFQGTTKPVDGEMRGVSTAPISDDVVDIGAVFGIFPKN